MMLNVTECKDLAGSDHRFRVAAIQELSRANQAQEGRVVAADLRILTIAPPTTIANGSAHDHSIHATSLGPSVATHTKAAPISAQRARASDVAATISLPLAANATIHPTNIAAITCPIAIPFVAKKTYALK